MDNKDSNNRIAKNTLFLYIRMLLTLVINLYTTRVLLVVLGVEDFGIFNVVCGFVSMLGFLNSSLSFATQRFFNYELGANGGKGVAKVYSSSLVVLLFIAFLFVLFFETFGYWYLTHEMVVPADRANAAFWIFQFSIVSMCFSFIQVPYSAFTLAKEHMDYYAYVGLVDVILKLIVVFLLQLVHSDKLIAYSMLLFVTSILNYLLFYIFVNRKYNFFRFDKHLDYNTMKSIISFSGWNVYESGAYMLNNQGVNLILNAFCGPVVNAARGIAFQINNALRQFSLNVVVAFKPQITQSYACGNYERTKSLFYYLTKISFVLMYMLSVPVILEIDYILDIWIGDNATPQHTAAFSVLVIINYLINIFNTPMSQVIQATGRIKKYQLAAGTIILLNLPFSWYALKIGLQPECVFLISIALSILTQIPCILLLKAEFDFSIKEYLRTCIYPLIPIVAVVPLLPLIIIKFLEPSFLRLFLVAMMVFISTVILFYFVLLNKIERERFMLFLRKKTNKLSH